MTCLTLNSKILLILSILVKAVSISFITFIPVNSLCVLCGQFPTRFIRYNCYGPFVSQPGGIVITFQPILVLLSALGLGAAHAFEPDHMAAVSTFVARRPSVRQAAGFGVQWAVGHGLSLIILGTILYFLKIQIQATVATGLERLVGFVLLGLGIWTLFQLRPGQIHHSHSHEQEEAAGETHAHADGTVHSHSHSHGHSHGRGSLWMGMLHGAAGTAAFVGEAFVAASNSYIMVLAYTVTFSIGVLVAMGAYAACLGGVISWSGHRVRAISVGAQMLTGVLACVVGICWIQGIEIPGLFSH